MNRRNFIQLTGALSFLSLPAVPKPQPGATGYNDTNESYMPPSLDENSDVIVAHGGMNKQGHQYPVTAWESFSQLIKSKCCFVTFLPGDGIPTGPSVNLEHICARITSLRVVPDEKYGYVVAARVRIIETPEGIRLLSILDGMGMKDKFFVVPSGMGTLQEGIVQDDYQGSCFFLTTDPSFEVASPLRLT